MDQVKLERLTCVLLQEISEELAEMFISPCDVKVSVLHNWMRNEIGIRVRQDVLGREMESIERSYPADWWQAFKARWYPRWALRRWPVTERTFRLVARELYPKLAMPDAEWAISLSESVS